MSGVWMDITGNGQGLYVLYLYISSQTIEFDAVYPLMYS